MDHHQLSADVLVAGGGLAGVSAAIAAARHDARVILLQDRPVLGGNSSSEVRMHALGADFHGAQPGRRETGLIEAWRLEDAYNNVQRCPQLWDLLLWDYVKRQPNIELLLNTGLDGVRMQSPDRIAAAMATRNSTEDRFTIEANLFIDCTGDGRLGAEAGAEFRVGREGRLEFGETRAPEQPDNRVLGSSILFMSRDHGRPMPFHAPSWARKFTEEDLAHRDHVPFQYGFWWVEWGGELDTIKDNEKIRDELLGIALGVWDHIKNVGDHGAENWALEWVGTLPGKRESRRFVGDYILKQQDLDEPVLFEDRVGYGGWPMDTHPPAGIYTREEPCDQPMLPQPYSIPLRSLYSRNIGNLLMAGRSISATHMAFSSTRIMATCAVLGEAVGATAALCSRRGIGPREVAGSCVAELQQLLLKDDCTILGLTNQDPRDLARAARATASSADHKAPPENVIDGHLRSEIGYPDSHLWISAEGSRLPQWLQLDLPQPAPVSHVRLTWDTNLHAPLFTTYSDAWNARMLRGPQPQTVRDYHVDFLVDGEWRTLVTVRDNYLRHRVHDVEPVNALSVRVVAEATHGATEARLYEARLYGPEADQ